MARPKPVFTKGRMRFLFGTGLVGGFSAGAIHYAWERNDDELLHADGNSLGGTGTTLYNFAGLTKEPSGVRLPLATNIKTPVDVCVIGGGFAGLHTALALAERGKKVMLLEGKRIGSGASGRNGGDALIGFHTSVDELTDWTGSKATANELFSHSEDGYNRLKSLIAKYRIACGAEEHGAVTMSFATERSPDSDAEVASAVDGLNMDYNQKLAFKDKKALEGMGIVSDRYRCGVFEPRNLALNPLELCFGLARACEQTGSVTIHENSKVLSVTKDAQGLFSATTALGSVKAKHCVLATNHAPASLNRKLAMLSTPISTHVMLTAPLPKEKLDKCFSAKTACFDDRFGLAYFRRVPGNRIMYGCFASGLPYANTPGTRAASEGELVADLARTFPPLSEDIKSERWWSGRLAVQYPIFPLVGREMSSGMYYSLAFAGHGLVPTCAAGTLLASAICDGDTRYELWSSVVPQWMPPTGGPTGYLGAALTVPMLRYYDNFSGKL